jgi:hypothetical protein
MNHRYYGKDYTMASMGLATPITLQDTPEHTTDEAYERELTRRLRSHEARDEVIERFLELVGSALVDEKGPLGEMQSLLEESPLIDTYDLDGWTRVGGPHDEPLARAIRKLYGEAHLAVASRIREQMADVAF